MARKAAKTGPGPMVIVALEQQFPEAVRILTDPLAFQILPFPSRAEIWLKLRLMSVDSMVRWMEKKIPGMWSGFLVRKRYIDDKVVEALGGRIDAVVNPGAGFDTRAYRLQAFSGTPVWEVDQPQTLRAKEARLKKVLGGIPVSITLVPIDFDHEGLEAVLDSRGYGADAKTFFIWEAVTQYLTQEGIRGTFEFLARAPAGSRLAFTYIRRDFLDGKALYGADYLYRKVVLKDGSFLFGMDPGEVGGFLEAYGWRIKEHLGYDALTDRYVKETGRQLLSTPLERMVYAEKT